MGLKQTIKNILIRKQNKEYTARLQALKMTYGEWLAEQAPLWRESLTAEEEQNAYVLLLFAKGALEEYAREGIGAYFAAHPQVDFVYADEDILDASGYHAPWFKPDWSPELFDSCFSIGSFLAVRKQVWEVFAARCGALLQKAYVSDTMVAFENREQFEPLVHELLPKEKAIKIHHMAGVLFHGLSEERMLSLQGGSAFLTRRERDRIAAFAKQEKPLISVIIPSKDHPELLRQCVQSLTEVPSGIPFEILTVDNGSSAENRRTAEELLQALPVPAKYLYEEAEFNFSRMCNAGAKEAQGSLFLFLNDDVVLSGGNLLKMAYYAAKSGAGAVGLKLLYPDSTNLQHCGITNLPMGPVHKLQHLSDDRAYLYNINKLRINCLAVTAACLMVNREAFWSVGGFCEDLRVAFNDVDLCYCLYESGLRNICLNDISAVHCESVSRGADETVEKVERLLSERDKLYERHPDLRGRDPYYSVCLNREGLDVRIAPCYEQWKNMRENLTGFVRIDAADYREDKCLMVRIEEMADERITGFSVVLGDDNSCYERMLVFQNTETKALYASPVSECYRPDLEQNMTDQKNVALCGFMIFAGETELPDGTYLIGACARNRVTGLKLLNYSNRQLRLQKRSEG